MNNIIDANQWLKFLNFWSEFESWKMFFFSKIQLRKYYAENGNESFAADCLRLIGNSVDVNVFDEHRRRFGLDYSIHVQSGLLSLVYKKTRRSASKKTGRRYWIGSESGFQTRGRRRNQSLTNLIKWIQLIHFQKFKKFVKFWKISFFFSGKFKCCAKKTWTWAFDDEFVKSPTYSGSGQFDRLSFGPLHFVGRRFFQIPWGLVLRDFLLFLCRNFGDNWIRGLYSG